MNLDFELCFFTVIQVSLQTPKNFTSVVVHIWDFFVLNSNIYREL